MLYYNEASENVLYERDVEAKYDTFMIRDGEKGLLWKVKLIPLRSLENDVSWTFADGDVSPNLCLLPCGRNTLRDLLPREILFGRKLDYKKELAYGFGEGL